VLVCACAPRWTARLASDAFTEAGRHPARARFTLCRGGQLRRGWCGRSSLACPTPLITGAAVVTHRPPGLRDAVLSSCRRPASQRVRVRRRSPAVHRNVTVTAATSRGAKYGLWAEEPHSKADSGGFHPARLDDDCLMAKGGGRVAHRLCAISGAQVGHELFSCQDVLLQSVTVSDIPYAGVHGGHKHARSRLHIDVRHGMWFMSWRQLELQDAAVVGSDVAFLFKVADVRPPRLLGRSQNVVTRTASSSRAGRRTRGHRRVRGELGRYGRPAIRGRDLVGAHSGGSELDNCTRE